MQIPLVGYVVGVSHRDEGTNTKTGEVIKEGSEVHILVPEKDNNKDTHVVQRVKCTRAFMARYKPAVIAKDAVLKPVQILCDLVQWEMNGNKGVSFKAVEAAS